MNVEKKGKDLVIKDLKDFDLAQTMECGQCFHFVRTDDREYEISAYGSFIRARQEKDRLIFFGITQKEFEDIWKKYFDLDRDYGKIKRFIV